MSRAAETAETGPREEAEGGLRGAAAPEEVAQRDFRQPRRFSGEFLERLRARLRSAAPDIERGLKRVFKKAMRINVVEMCEVDADELLSTLAPPLAMANFTVGGQPAWIRWDARGAVYAVEHLLGSPTSAAARALSQIESLFLRDSLVPVVDGCCRALGLEADGLEIAKEPEDVVHWRDGGAEAEPHRLSIAFEVEGLGEGSQMVLWLPGLRDERPTSGEEGIALPEHLDRVRIDLSAHLGASDVPLSDLLSLEIGDVIPLGTTLSDPLVLRIEGHPCGTAEMGSARGNRAVRILEVNPHLEDLA